MRQGMHGLIGVATAVLLAVGISGAASAASTASGWTVQPVPKPAVFNGYDLPAASCPTATSCMAITNSVSPTVTEQWNGSTWTPQTLPKPGNGAFLNGISCTSPTACTAVGFWVNEVTNDDEGLAEEWNGSTWTDQILAAPPGQSDGILTAVSCLSATDCIALSHYTATVSGVQVPLAEHWNGSTWTAHPTAPLPSGTREATLHAISCSSAASCTAVGDSSLDTPLAEHWNGRAWTLQATQAAGSGNFLGAVSCTSAANCTAVGGYGDSSTTHFLPLAEHWNGSTWQITAIPLPSRGKDGILDGVSCPSANRCTAVGWWNRSVSTGAHNAWAEVWNGTTWRNQPTASPIFRQTLLGISCVAARTCTAVGEDRQSRLLLAEHE